jgi:hypothetical protein
MQFGLEKAVKNGFDRSVTGRLNWGWAFVFKGSYKGGGARRAPYRPKSPESP